MKHFFLIILAICLCLPSMGQDIQSLTIYPANPTTSDQISVTAVVDNFPWGNCDASAHSWTLSNWRIDGQAYHQLGGLAVICSSTDNFSLGMFSAGTYWYVHTVTSSSGGTDVDSVQFTVTTTTGIGDMNSVLNYTLFPQPAIDRLSIRSGTATNNEAELRIYDSSGRTVLDLIFVDDTNVDISDLGSGVYYYRIISGNEEQIDKLIIL